MSEDDILWLSALEMGRRIRARTLTAEAVTEAHLARIARLNPLLQAYVTVTAERARAEAQAADAEIATGNCRGPLHGVPYCLKDIIATAGVRTTVGSYILADWVPHCDATVVVRLKAAGAVLLGKVNTHEFAFGATTQNVHGRTGNPWNPACIPGGSSGGSAAAVAAAMAAFSVGSDTAGSIRAPAALCGVVGFKPSYGAVSAAGVVAQSYTSDHVGPFAREVADVAVVMQVLGGHDPLDPTSDPAFAPAFADASAKLRPAFRIGLPAELLALPCAEAVRQGLDAATAALRALRVEIRQISLPLLAEASAINVAIVPPETAAQHIAWAKSWFAGRTIRYHDDVAALLAQGRAVTATDFIAASRAREELRGALERALDPALPNGCDLLLTPTVPVLAPLRGAASVSLAGQERDFLEVAIQYLCPFSLAGLPALSVPAGFSEEGLPLAVQLVGRRRDDAAVLAAGAALQAALRLQGRRPPLPSS